MKKDNKTFLEHIQQSILAIENHTKSFSKTEFFKDTKTQDAVVRRLEIIGEATKNLLADFKNKNPDIKWRNIAAMRDKLTHEYFGVDLDVVWDTIKKDIPKLKKQIAELLKKL